MEGITISRIYVKFSLVKILFSITLVAFLSLVAVLLVPPQWLRSELQLLSLSLLLVVANVVVVAVVVMRITRHMPEWKRDLRASLMDLRRDSLEDHFKARAGGLSPEEHLYLGEFLAHIDADLVSLRGLIVEMLAEMPAEAPFLTAREKLISLRRMLPEGNEP